MQKTQENQGCSALEMQRIEIIKSFALFINRAMYGNADPNKADSYFDLKDSSRYEGSQQLTIKSSEGVIESFLITKSKNIKGLFEELLQAQILIPKTV